MEETSAEPPTNRLPGLDDLEQECWQEFLNASARLVDMLSRRLLAEHKLTLFDFLLLDMLNRSPGGWVRMGDLAQELMVNPSRISQQVRRLESQGLVGRARSTKDLRGVVAVITRQGREKVKPAARAYAQDVRRYYLDQMSRRQMIALSDGCRRISQGAKAAEPPGFEPL
ncbi:MarR family winged helix-turn-helix transcriptional regulator [Mycobacterium sp. SMC-15]|uniref:MarR family winged helix-turn-helix transcriptional regulator n=1 Tax=Mycobacterium sp. SMC-15 TaxID=3381627 RepID=UPI003875B2ED